MSTISFFKQFLEQVKETSYWQAMEGTVENSPYHREKNVGVHTEMAIQVYLERFAPHRTEREQLLALIGICAHDFGKPAAEETLEKKDQPGVFYRRYVGHEPISANEFMSFICDHHELRQQLFDRGYTWEDVRRIKFMIEHHLPYGLKNPQKRADLRQAIALTMQDTETAYWDLLRSDAAGRISDDHATKLQAVEDFIEPFKALPWKRTDENTRYKGKQRQPTMYVLCGPSGAGKSTWTNAFMKGARYLKEPVTVVCEDEYRLAYAAHHMADLNAWVIMTPIERYAFAWKFCHLNPASTYEEFVKAQFKAALADQRDIVLDRMNPTRKSRSPWIQAAKQQGYKVVSVEFYVSESELNRRQLLRTDKLIPLDLVHKTVMRMEVPWYGPEVDGFELVPQV